MATIVVVGCLWEPRGLLSSDIVPRNRSPPAVVVTVLRRGQGHYNACYTIQRSTGQVCTCPVKLCWVRHGGRSSIGEDDVACRGWGDEWTSRLSIDRPWFTPLIIWVSLSLTLFLPSDNNLTRLFTTRRPASSPT